MPLIEHGRDGRESARPREPPRLGRRVDAAVQRRPRDELALSPQADLERQTAELVLPHEPDRFVAGDRRDRSRAPSRARSAVPQPPIERATPVRESG
jgi:hypothetical protein